MIKISPPLQTPRIVQSPSCLTRCDEMTETDGIIRGRGCRRRDAGGEEVQTGLDPPIFPAVFLDTASILLLLRACCSNDETNNPNANRNA